MKRKLHFRLPSAKQMSIFFLLAACLFSINAVAQKDTSTVTVQQILDAQNAYRTEVGVPALAWSDELAQYAQSWANELATNRGCNMQHRPNDDNDAWNQKYGENIFSGGGTNWSPTVLDAVSDWASEKKDFNSDTKECNSGGTCGHYTQMVWKSTTQVGCGVATCSDGNVIVVCNYNPAGNMVGEKPY